MIETTETLFCEGASARGWETFDDLVYQSTISTLFGFFPEELMSKHSHRMVFDSSIGKTMVKPW